ncbi:MAG: phosphodiesterase [Mycobacterium sp.]
MKASDIVAVPLQWGSAIRRRRVFHPVGVMANGSLERLAPPGEGLPMESSDVLGRVSKAVGLPGGLPDIIGLAVRIPPQPFAATPWDILMASAGSGLVTRFALRPVASWHASLSSLMPLRYDGKYWWVRAKMTSELNAEGLALDDIADQIDRGGVEFELDQAAGTEDFRPLARVRFDEVVPAGPSNEVAFDPTLHTAPGVKLAPEWLTDIRQRAYERSRAGRPD